MRSEVTSDVAGHEHRVTDLGSYHMIKRAIVLAAAALLSAHASANTPVYDGSVTGNQNYGQMLGLDFTAQSNVWVTQLGVFDSGMDGLVGAIQVGLYDVTNAFATVIAPVTFAAGTLNGGTQYIFQNVTPVQLVAGNTYSVQASGFSSADPNWNTNLFPGTNQGPDNQSTTPITFNSFGGALLNQESRWGGALGQAGTAFDNSSAFGAGTVAVVPEPQAYALALAGLGLVGFVARRRKPH